MLIRILDSSMSNGRLFVGKELVQFKDGVADVSEELYSKLSKKRAFIEEVKLEAKEGAGNKSGVKIPTKNATVQTINEFAESVGYTFSENAETKQDMVDELHAFLDK